MHELFYIIKSLAMLVAVILLANYLLKYLSRYQSQRNQHIQVIEKLSVTKDSALSIVKIGETFYLMSFASRKNEILKEFSPAEQAELNAKITLKQAEAKLNNQSQVEVVQNGLLKLKGLCEKGPKK